MAELEIHAKAQRIPYDAGALAGQLRWRRRDIAAEAGADDGVVGAGIEQQRSRMAVHFGVNEDQRMYGTKREESGFPVAEAGWREKGEGRENRG